MILPPSFIKARYVYCPIWDGVFNGKDCEFCDDYGFLYLLEEESDEIEYSTYFTYLRRETKYFKHSTNEIVIVSGFAFFNEEPTPNKYIKFPEGIN